LKGQYLAVETVFTFGLGLIVAVSIVTLFNQYKVSVLSGAEEDQVEMIHSEIVSGMSALREADSSTGFGRGRYEVGLPDTVSGSEYTLDFDGEKLEVDVENSESYSKNLTGFSGYRKEGGGDGGDVTILKRGNNFTLRAN
jgi:hypothetical protein